MKTRVYEAWRRSEAYAVSMTEDGLAKAEDRYKSFSLGYISGLRAAAEHLELKHKEVKDTTKLHNFYLVASRFIRELYNES